MGVGKNPGDVSFDVPEGKTRFSYCDEMLDIAYHGRLAEGHLEVTVSEDGTVLWVNLDGQCVLRICRFRGVLIFDDKCAKTRLKEEV